MQRVIKFNSIKWDNFLTRILKHEQQQAMSTEHVDLFVENIMTEWLVFFVEMLVLDTLDTVCESKNPMSSNEIILFFFYFIKDFLRIAYGSVEIDDSFTILRQLISSFGWTWLRMKRYLNDLNRILKLFRIYLPTLPSMACSTWFYE